MPFTAFDEVVCRRQMPLSAEAGANAVNAQDTEQPSEHGVPTMKKPKGIEKAKVNTAKKRSLKRL